MFFEWLDERVFWCFVPIVVGITPFCLMWGVSRLSEITQNMVGKGKNIGGK
jgi:hypothetical protein